MTMYCWTVIRHFTLIVFCFNFPLYVEGEGGCGTDNHIYQFIYLPENTTNFSISANLDFHADPDHLHLKFTSDLSGDNFVYKLDVKRKAEGEYEFSGKCDADSSLEWAKVRVTVDNIIISYINGIIAVSHADGSGIIGQAPQATSIPRYFVYDVNLIIIDCSLDFGDDCVFGDQALGPVTCQYMPAECIYDKDFTSCGGACTYDIADDIADCDYFVGLNTQTTPDVTTVDPSPTNYTPTPGGATPTSADETSTPGGATPTSVDEAPTAGGATPTSADETPTPGDATYTPADDTPPGGVTPTPADDTPTAGDTTLSPGGATHTTGGTTPTPAGVTPSVIITPDDTTNDATSNQETDRVTTEMETTTTFETTATFTTIRPAPDIVTEENIETTTTEPVTYPNEAKDLIWSTSFIVLICTTTIAVISLLTGCVCVLQSMIKMPRKFRRVSPAPEVEAQNAKS